MCMSGRRAECVKVSVVWIESESSLDPLGHVSPGLPGLLCVSAYLGAGCEWEIELWQQLLCLSELTNQRGLGAAQLAEAYPFCCSLWLRGRHEKVDYRACLT